MKRWWKKLLCLVILAGILMPGIALAGGEKAAPIVIVADTRHLDGMLLWWANLYNESHLYFTIVTVLLIPSIGVIFGVIADFVMKHIGIDLKSRELAEH